MKHIIIVTLIATLAVSAFFHKVTEDKAAKLERDKARLCVVYWKKANRYIKANRTDLYAERALMNYQIKINKYCS